MLGSSFQPPLSTIIQRIPASTKAAIKVAPATPEDPCVPGDAELEWIGDRRECKQQVIWLGGTQRIPGSRVATLVDQDVSTSFTASHDELDTPQEIALDIGQYIYEPHASVLAAGLVDAFCAEFDLRRLFQDVVYLTSNKLLNNPLAAQFEIVELLPMDPRRTAQALERLDAGNVEYKKRWVTEVFYKQFKKIKTRGSQPFTVLLSPMTGGNVSIIARRIPCE